MLVAQISDTHIKLPGRLAYGVVDTAAMLRACVAEIAALDFPPDLVVVTGDLVELGSPEEYAHVRDILRAIECEILVIPGNHDDRDAMRRAFSDHAYMPPSGFLHFAVERGALRFVGLDTLVPGEGGGALCSERLTWLDAALRARPEMPTVVLMHHPPFLTGIAHMDKLGLRGRNPFADIVRRHPQVQVILSGHVHRTIRGMVGGRAAMSCPSPAHQITLDLRADGPGSFRMEPPGYLLHRWCDGHLASHVAVLGNWAGPFPFFDATADLSTDARSTPPAPVWQACEIMRQMPRAAGKAVAGSN